MLKNVAIIPARGGSKGLIKKNIRLLHEKPLIAWSIEFALRNKHINDCIVTTDSYEIANISEDYGAQVPFIREAKLASDTAKSSDVIIDVIKKCKLNPNNIFVLLEPTSPFRLHKSFEKLTEVFQENNLRKIVSVQESISSSFRFQFYRNNDTTLNSINLTNPVNNVRRQDIKKSFFLDGSFYMSYISDFLKYPGFIEKKTGSYINDYFSSFEIDSEEDLKLMESIFSFIGPPF